MKKTSHIHSLQALLLAIFFVSPFLSPGQTKIVNKQLNYELTLPSSLSEKEQDNDTFLIYIDTASEIALMVSAREATFKDINSYLDCSTKDLEQRLRQFQEDSTLKLVECRRSAYYPERAVVLHIETKAYYPEFDRCLIYFVHQERKELQFFFLYNKANNNTSLTYIETIMKTLKLTTL